jgi:uncharacterized phage-like protein YoqJ
MLTGHRLQDLPCKFDRFHPWKLQKLKNLADFLVEKKPKALISGMAIGFDQWAAHTAIKQGISVWAYIPCDNQERLWRPEQKTQYNFLLTQCSAVKVISPGPYSVWKMYRRNEAMLRDADEVLALWNPQKKSGGTYNTVATALSMNKKVTNFYNDIRENILSYD